MFRPHEHKWIEDYNLYYQCQICGLRVRFFECERCKEKKPFVYVSIAPESPEVEDGGDAFFSDQIEVWGCLSCGKEIKRRRFDEGKI